MQEYCINRDDLDFLIDVTKFKTKGSWNEDPMQGIPPAVKSSFTRLAFALPSLGLAFTMLRAHPVWIFNPAQARSSKGLKAGSPKEG